MPDFDAAIKRTVDAQQRIAEAAQAVSGEIAERRQVERPNEPVMLAPVVVPAPEKP